MDLGAPGSSPAVVVAVDGVTVAVHDLGGSRAAPLVLMAHAAGFHGRVWAPVSDRLTERFHCFALDFRGHGASGMHPDGHVDFDGLAADVLAAIDGLELRGAYGFGHSSGATALLLAEEARPGSFAALWCWEPVIVPADPPLGPDPDNWLAAATRVRRTRFSSAAAALAAYRQRSALATVRSDVLAIYVTYGVKPVADGVVELLCRPDVEAQIYETATANDCFAQLAAITCPVVLARGAASEAFPPATAAAAARRLGSVTVQVIDGLGHLGPLEDPDGVARCILDALDGRDGVIAQRDLGDGFT